MKVPTGSVKELKRATDAKSLEVVNVFNPDTDDFVVQYDGLSYTLEAGKMKKFVYKLGQHVAKHLADKILNKRNLKTNQEPDRSKLLKRILI